MGKTSVGTKQNVVAVAAVIKPSAATTTQRNDDENREAIAVLVYH